MTFIKRNLFVLLIVVRGELMSIERDFKELEALKPGWDSYGAPVPSKKAVAIARHIVSELKTPPLMVRPSAEGGVGIVLKSSDTEYEDIEVFNTGEVLKCTSDRKGNIKVGDYK